MRKIPLALILPVFLLSGCRAPAAEDAVSNAMQLIADCRTISADASVTADYGDHVYDFVLRCELSSDGGTVTIISPDIVSGVNARVESDGVTLCYDGAEIYTGALTQSGLSPMEAFPVMVNAWKNGLAEMCVFEKYGDIQCAAAEFVSDDDVTFRTWFDADTSLPVAAEISSSGQTVLTCRTENVILE